MNHTQQLKQNLQFKNQLITKTTIMINQFTL
jgi:hypothetical protein